MPVISNSVIGDVSFLQEKLASLVTELIVHMAQESEKLKEDIGYGKVFIGMNGVPCQ